jgi:predicted Fe-Mo cluster-binding NifX family protein
MRLCIPTADGSGLEAPLSPHFGRSAFFTVVDPEDGAVGIHANGGHDHGNCGAVETIRQLGADAVICRGIGAGAFSNLSRAGIELFVTEAETVALALDDFREGRSQRLGGGTCEESHHGGCRH